MAKQNHSPSQKVLIHTVIIPATYDPPDDLSARMAAWLVRQTSLYRERILFHYWIPLSAALGRKMFGGNWHRAVNSAISTGLAEWNSSYSTGIDGKNKPFPKAIRLRERHMSGGAKQYRLKRSVAKQANHNLSPVGTWLAQWLPEFDLPDDIQPKSLWEACHIETIRSKQFYATQCEQGRFHSNFTTTAKRHRSGIRHRDTPLARLDIQCSQPTLLDALVKTGTNSPVAMICYTSSDFYEALLPLATGCDEYWDVKKKASPPSSSANLAPETSWRQQLPWRWGREDVKANLLKAIFSKNHVMVKQPAFIALSQLFPVHAAYIKEVKRKDHRILAQNLQRLEASIIIDGVCGHLSQYHPHTPVLTIHDELIVPQDMAAIVHQLILAKFAKHGVVAKVTRENLS